MDEWEDLVEACKKMKVMKQTKTGPLFLVSIPTSAGLLRLLKIRLPDETRPERGDAYFTVRDYKAFKSGHLGKPGFQLIKRENFEMIELMDKAFDVRAYFSNPPLDEQLGLV